MPSRRSFVIGELLEIVSKGKCTSVLQLSFLNTVKYLSVLSVAAWNTFCCTTAFCVRGRVWHLSPHLRGPLIKNARGKVQMLNRYAGLTWARPEKHLFDYIFYLSQIFFFIVFFLLPLHLFFFFSLYLLKLAWHLSVIPLC